MAGNSTSLGPSLIALNPEALAGPILAGILANFLLFGFLSMQFCVYYIFFPNDKLYVKLLAYSVYFVELVQIGCAIADARYWFVTSFRDPSHIGKLYISPFDVPLLGSVVAFIVHLFFSYRIWTLRRSDWYILLSVLIASVSLLQLVGGIGNSVIGHRENSSTELSSTRSSLAFVSIWLVADAAADIMIAVTMVYLLLSSSPDISMQSRRLVIHIVRLIVHTNALTASVATIVVILAFTLPGKTYFLPLCFMLGKLYSNTLFATLNHRVFLRQMSADNLKSAPQFDVSI
jgi:hypothetical protein